MKMKNSSIIEAVVFDWGGVIIENPVEGILEFLKKEFPGVETTGIDESTIIDYQKGVFSETELWKKLGAAESLDLNQYGGSLWRSAFESTYTEKKPVVELAKTLRMHGITTAMLSNTEQPAVEMLMDMKYTCFDHFYFSCSWGLVKPDPAIYYRCIEALDLPAETILFIDDKEENIIAAELAGMNGHVMRDYPALDRRLKELKLPGLRM